MTDQPAPARNLPAPALRCPACGNEDYFVEIVDFEAHLLNRNLNYVRTLHSELDRLECYQCGEEIDYDPFSPVDRESQNAPL